MKRIRLLILLSVLAVALPVGLLSGVAKATGGSGTSVSISQTADFNTFGSQLDVHLVVRCTGGLGLAEDGRQPRCFGDSRSVGSAETIPVRANAQDR